MSTDDLDAVGRLVIQGTRGATIAAMLDIVEGHVALGSSGQTILESLRRFRDSFDKPAPPAVPRGHTLAEQAIAQELAEVGEPHQRKVLQ